MATARRVFWESAIFLAFLAVLAGVVVWSGNRVERQAESLENRHDQALTAADQRHQDEIETLRQGWDNLSRAQAKEQAKAVFSAFEAGIHTAATARWGRYLDNAKDSLAAHPAITFIHLVTPQGRIITTTDDELATSGRLDELGEWALSAQELSSRDGSVSGTLELAAPIVESGRTVAVLWMGYDLSAVAATSGSGS